MSDVHKGEGLSVCDVHKGEGACELLTIRGVFVCVTGSTPSVPLGNCGSNGGRWSC